MNAVMQFIRGGIIAVTVSKTDDFVKTDKFT